MQLTKFIPLIFLTALPFAAVGQTEVYRNSDFRYEVQIPRGLYLFSPHEMTGIDHGRQLFFKPTRVEDCNNGGCDRYIGFYADYNTTDDTAKLHDLLEHTCTVFGGKKCLQPPEDLKIEGLPSESARVKLPNGNIEMIVVTQAGKPAPDFDASVPSINYSIVLLTTKKHLEEDMRSYRLILKTIRISPSD